MKVNIVGCGISGSVAAILLKEKGHSVEIFETRPHIAGNCYDSLLNGIRVHNYGAHIFHTNDDDVWNFLNRYTKFNGYQHQVKAHTKDKDIIPIPFNDISASIVGEKSEDEIVDLLFREYTQKHWGISYDDMPKSITNRNNLSKIRREGADCRYFLDKYQGIPANGYTAMFEAMLDGITVHTGVGPDEWRKYMDGMWTCDMVVYTGKADAFFKHCYGELPYRSLTWEYAIEDRKDVTVLNECNSFNKYTRTVDHSHWHDQDPGYTVVSREYACEHDGKNIPIYPKPFGEGQALYGKYKKLAQSHPNVIFLGRLATYKYLDMWMAIKQVMVKLRGL
jgi:UDP-galactopyranose mutase